MNVKKRHIIYAQDIMVFTGRSRSYAYSVIKQVKEYYGKSKHQLVTVQEYAEFHGIPVKEVETSILEETNK
ncbi:hypothetical protein [Algoriphagus pacificus]|uniref:Uncharacterized protein n=1 Tax=Algoriphagus pacificus TaxID=2811234 RepID=A0ABS3CKA4_9BACT|nr:hypothetical protein [Algoriphagus pacificus]MBN7816911.1 hypothetical protein [Algoriphagus pacificus]